MSTHRVPATFAAVAALTLASTPAWAGGSDAPTPYTVDEAGITLPAPLEAHGHVNIRTTGGESFGIHLDPNNGHPGGRWIGERFMPWSAFSDAPLCVEWVQVAGFNEHFGEGGQTPVGPGCVPSVEGPTPDPKSTPELTPEPTPDPEPTDESTPEPTPTPAPEPELTDEPEPDPSPEPDPVIPPKPAPHYWGDRVVYCEAGLTAIIDYRADWVWGGTEWALDEAVPVAETTVPAGEECAPAPDAEPELGEGTPAQTPAPASTDATRTPGAHTAPTVGELAETGVSGAQVAAAIALILSGVSLALAARAGRK